MGRTKKYALGEFSEVADSIEEALEKARAFFHTAAHTALDAQIAKGNNVYTLYADGRNINNRVAINTAVRTVKITFPLPGIDLALKIMVDALKTEIAARTSSRETQRLQASIRIWYGEVGETVREVTGTSEIKNFGPGDWIAMVPDLPIMPFINSHVADKNGGRGFMARTAARIRRTLRIRKNAGGLQIQAGRSTAIGMRMAIPPKRGTRRRKRVIETRPMPAHIWNTTAPAIFVRWRPTNLGIG